MTNSDSRMEYLRRIYKVQDYIEANLVGSFTLEELAEVAGFSKFHFHRIFKGITKESLSQYVNRVKMEKAAFFLIYRPNMTITDVAYHFGFTDSAVFSRSFKNHYQVSPLQYRNQYSKNCKDPRGEVHYNETIRKNEGADTGSGLKGNIEVLTIEEMQVVYIRHLGSYEELTLIYPDLIKKLFTFAEEEHLLEDGGTKMLSIYHDYHEITKEENLKTSLCMTIPKGRMVRESSEISTMTIPSMKYVIGHFEIYQKEYREAWDFLCGEWLSNSGYQPGDSYAFEVYLNDPRSHPQNKHIVDIYLPIGPLQIL